VLVLAHVLSPAEDQHSMIVQRDTPAGSERPKRSPAQAHHSRTIPPVNRTLKLYFSRSDCQVRYIALKCHSDFAFTFTFT
jgi:hypothetical protein